MIAHPLCIVALVVSAAGCDATHRAAPGPSPLASTSPSQPAGGDASPAASATSAARPQASDANAGTALQAGPPPNVTMPGGVESQDPTSPEVRSAAAEAVTLLRAAQRDSTIRLITIRSASVQVAVGLEYTLMLEVSTRSGRREVSLTMNTLDGPGHGRLTRVNWA